MMFASASVLMIEQPLQTAASSICVFRESPTDLLLLGEALQGQQLGLIQAFIKLLPLRWVSECAGLCLCPLSVCVSHSVTSHSLWPHGLYEEPLGSSVHGIFQAKLLAWVAIFFFRGSSQSRDQTLVSHIAGRLFMIWAPREALWEWSLCCLLALPYASSACPQSQTFWALASLVQDPWTKESSVGLRPLASSEETLQLWLSSCLWVTHAGVWVLTLLFLCPSYPSHCGPFFIFLAVKSLSC